jgi:exopolysaccharide biosynthesis protein
VLLLRGVRRVVDDRELHPRTAIGIDHESGRVLMLVVDGRQSFSRGYTMVELANLMQSLGADDALNLDGGGSSTLLSYGPDGVVGVRNSPSDGFERRVANGLEITYRP